MAGLVNSQITTMTFSKSFHAVDISHPQWMKPDLYSYPMTFLLAPPSGQTLA